jgi:hypothetical protein
LGDLRERRGNLFQTSQRDLIRCIKIFPLKIKPIETFAKITYASDFDPEFCLLLRERRATSLAHMQDAPLEVESNILAVENLGVRLIETEENVGLKL